MNTHDIEQIKEVLKGSLSLDIETTSVYTGGLDGSALYKDSHTIVLKLDGEIISEVSL